MPLGKVYHKAMKGKSGDCYSDSKRGSLEYHL